MQSFQPIRKRRLSDEVAEQIRTRVISGELKPGDKLPSERDLAELFRVGRGAIREAMRNLELSGLIVLHKGAKGGAFITEVNERSTQVNIRDFFYLGGISLDELTEARVSIESLVARLACENATEEDFAALEANVDEAERLFKEELYDQKIDVNIEFHNILARSTHNKILAVMMSALMDVMRDFAIRVGGERHDLTIRCRRKLLKCMRERKVAAAGKLMEDYVNQVHRRYHDIIEHAATRR